VARNKSVAKDDPAFEISFYEKVLKHSPGFIEALVALAELYTKEGLYDKGLELDRRLVVLRPEDPVIQYNLACSLSLKGDIPAAFDAMKRAVANGYEDFTHLEKDEDLLNLLSDPGFQDYYRGLKSAGKDV
jgi:tetratricopeptide (TPR) repeat protein